MFISQKEINIIQHAREVVGNYVRPYIGVAGYPVHDWRDPVYMGLVSVIARLSQYYYPDMEAVEIVNKYMQSDEFTKSVLPLYDYNCKYIGTITKTHSDGRVEVETFEP